MGNSIGTDLDPPQLFDLYNATRVQNLDKERNPQQSFAKNFLYMWSFDFDKSIGFVTSQPLVVAKLKKLNPQLCYLVMYLSHKENTKGVDKNSLPATFIDFLESIEENVSPRGLSGSFNFVNGVTANNYSTYIYIWNGNTSTRFVRACALANAFKLEKALLRSDVISFIVNADKSALIQADAQNFTKYNPDKNDLLSKILNPKQSQTDFSIIKDSILVPSIPLSPRVKPEPAEGALPADFEVWSSSAQVKYFETVCSQITEYMYLGSRLISESRPSLDKYKITHVLNCAGGICKNYFPSDYTYKTLWLMDASDQDISALFYDVIEYIDEARKNNGIVYVHCHQGVSRSSSMVICYLMWKNNWAFQHAHEHVKKLRPVCSPNTGFIAQLLRWYKRLQQPAKNSRLYEITQHSAVNDPNFLVPKFLESATSLASATAYVFHTPNGAWLWIGKDCPESWVEAGRRTIQHLHLYEKLKTEFVTIVQGQEPDTFWSEFKSYKATL